MLANAYRHLGLVNAQQIDLHVQSALRYLEKDREHYIEAAPGDVPEYLITTRHGVVCHLIPLAQRILREKKKDHVQENRTVLSLMVTDQKVRYVCATSFAQCYADRSRNRYSYPVYRYVQLNEVPKDLRIDDPQNIRPIAADKDREIFGMLFMAFARLGENQHINSIPRRTERAMQTVPHTLPEMLSVDADCVTGKVIPLAQEDSLWEDMREDHTYRYRKELCLFIGKGAPRYLMKTHHIYHYFRKTVFDDVPGGYAYQPTADKREITCKFVTLEDIPKDMSPLYH